MNLCKTESMSVVLDDRDAFYIYVVFILKKNRFGGGVERARGQGRMLKLCMILMTFINMYSTLIAFFYQGIIM